MLRMGTLPAGCIEPCLPTKTNTLPSGGLWVHEIKQSDNRPTVSGHPRTFFHSPKPRKPAPALTLSSSDRMCLGHYRTRRDKPFLAGSVTSRTSERYHAPPADRPFRRDCEGAGEATGIRRYVRRSPGGLSDRQQELDPPLPRRRGQAA